MEARVAANQAQVEQALLSHVPEGAESLRAIHERWEGFDVIGVSLLLMEFGDEFLMPELNRHKHATDVVRRVYRVAEQLLADEDMLFRDAAYFGLVEPLGLAVHYLSPEDVGPLVARAIESTYPAYWAVRLDEPEERPCDMSDCPARPSAAIGQRQMCAPPSASAVVWSTA